MSEDDEREKLKRKGAEKFVEKLGDEFGWSDEEKQIFKLGIYCGLKYSIQMDVYEIGMRALRQEYGDLEDE